MIARHFKAITIALVLTFAATTARAECDADAAYEGVHDNLPECVNATADIRTARWYIAITAATLTVDDAPELLDAVRWAIREDQSVPHAWRQWVSDTLVRRVENASAEDGDGSLLLEPNVATMPDDAGDLDAYHCSCSFYSGALTSGGDGACIVLQEEASTRPNNDCELRQVEATPSQVARMVHYQFALRTGILKLGEERRLSQLAGLQTARRRWRSFLLDGYPQFPWELPLNGARYSDADFASFTPDDLDPPLRQYIFLHPTVGVGFTGFGRGEPAPSAQAVGVVGLEVFGILRYNEGRSQFYGASALLSFDNFNFEDPRLGVIVHLTRYLQLGYAHSLRRADATLILSVDVFGWAQKAASLAGCELPDVVPNGEAG